MMEVSVPMFYWQRADQLCSCARLVVFCSCYTCILKMDHKPGRAAKLQSDKIRRLLEENKDSILKYRKKIGPNLEAIIRSAAELIDACNTV